MRLVLIGPRGCGKTTIGRLLAERLRCAFIDLDDRAAAQFNQRTVTDIWAKHGEAAWRSAEVRALRELLQSPHPAHSTQHPAPSASQVIALGGGAPAIPEAREMLLAEKSRSAMRIVYLKCSIEELARRLSADPGDRPALTGRGPLEEIAQVLAQREPIYEALADAIQDAASEPVAVAEAIMRI